VDKTAHSTLFSYGLGKDVRPGSFLRPLRRLVFYGEGALLYVPPLLD